MARMRERFHSDVAVQATELLLQERTPRDVSVAHPRAEEVGTAARVTDPQVPDMRRLTSPHDSAPQTHLLSNGRYAVMITAAGSGYSRWNDLAITRWREDITRDDTGSYLCCVISTAAGCGRPAISPAPRRRTSYEVSFTEDRAEIIRVDGDLMTTLEVQVSPEDDAEVRRLSISNNSIARARDRSDLVCRTGAGRAGGGRCPPGVLQAVRAHRVPAEGERAARQPAPPRAR